MAFLLFWDLWSLVFLFKILVRLLLYTGRIYNMGRISSTGRISSNMGRSYNMYWFCNMVRRCLNMRMLVWILVKFVEVMRTNGEVLSEMNGILLQLVVVRCVVAYYYMLSALIDNARESARDLFGVNAILWLWYVVVLIVMKLCYLFGSV